LNKSREHRCLPAGFVIEEAEGFTNREGEGISEYQIKGWQSCSPKPPRPLSSDAVVAKVLVCE